MDLEGNSQYLEKQKRFFLNFYIFFLLIINTVTQQHVVQENYIHVKIQGDVTVAIYFFI